MLHIKFKKIQDKKCKQGQFFAHAKKKGKKCHRDIFFQSLTCKKCQAGTTIRHVLARQNQSFA